MSAKPNVFLVEDDEAMRRAITRALEGEGFRVESFACAEDFLKVIGPGRRGMVLMDMKLEGGGMDGLRCQEALCQRGIRTPVVFISGNGTVASSVSAMKQGALDWLEKPFGTESLFERVRGALALDARLRAEHAAFVESDGRFGDLTRRETQVMWLVVDGLTSNEIALKLGISAKTVSLHRAHLMAKMGAGGVADLVRMVVGRRRPEPPPANAPAADAPPPA